MHKVILLKLSRVFDKIGQRLYCMATGHHWLPIKNKQITCAICSEKIVGTEAETTYREYRA